MCVRIYDYFFHLQNSLACHHHVNSQRVITSVLRLIDHTKQPLEVDFHIVSPHGQCLTMVTFVGNNSSAVMSLPFRPSLNLFNPDARPRADVWWACSIKERMVQTLPRNWTGTCTPVRIILLII